MINEFKVKDNGIWISRENLEQMVKQSVKLAGNFKKDGDNDMFWTCIGRKMLAMEMIDMIDKPQDTKFVPTAARI